MARLDRHSHGRTWCIWVPTYPCEDQGQSEFQKSCSFSWIRSAVAWKVPRQLGRSSSVAVCQHSNGMDQNGRGPHAVSQASDGGGRGVARGQVPTKKRPMSSMKASLYVVPLMRSKMSCT